MKNKFFSAIKSNPNWLAISLIIIASLLIAVSLFFGGVGGLVLSESLYYLGLMLLFIGLLNPWGKWNRKYYAILFGISALLLVLLYKVGIGALVKIQSKFQISGHWAEDMVGSFGFMFIAGFLAGLIGFFIFIRRKS